MDPVVTERYYNKIQDRIDAIRQDKGYKFVNEAINRHFENKFRETTNFMLERCAKAHEISK